MALSVKREIILTALFERLSSVSFDQPVRGATGFVSMSRRLRHWADVPKIERPALFMVCHGESVTYRSENTPAYAKFSVKLFIYIDGSDKTTTPDTDISVILDALDVALSPGPGEQRLTLGGIVSHCRLDGEILRDPGDMDDDGLIVVPISVTTT